MNLYINIPYKTGEHKNETKNTNYICLYIKISISPLFFPPFSPQGPRSACGAPVRATGSVVRVRTSTQNTSMQKVKTNPYRYNFKVLASKMRFQLGMGSRGREKKFNNQSTFNNGAYKLASGVLTLNFFFRLFDFNLFELKYTKKCTRIHQLNNYKTVSEMKLLMYTHAASTGVQQGGRVQDRSRSVPSFCALCKPTLCVCVFVLSFIARLRTHMHSVDIFTHVMCVQERSIQHIDIFSLNIFVMQLFALRPDVCINSM